MQNEARVLRRKVLAKMIGFAAGVTSPKGRSPWNRPCQQGFSLIEVLIALVVFSVGILAVASMQITSTGGNAKARYISEATSWGVDKMEDLLNRSYDDAELNDTNS